MAPSRSSESRRPAVASVEVVGSGTVVVEVVLGTVDVDDVDVLDDGQRGEDDDGGGKEEPGPGTGAEAGRRHPSTIGVVAGTRRRRTSELGGTSRRYGAPEHGPIRGDP